MSDKSYLLEFYVPEENLEEVLEAIFEVGAGRYKDYDRCAWITKGEGRFRPLKNSNPYIGKINQETKVTEMKVECMVKQECVQEVKAALLSAHPYEEPAYHFIVKNII